jgi:hypothetical protein
MDRDDAGRTARYLIRDRHATFPALFDALLADAGVKTVLSGVRMPRMNSIIERWIHSCRHELPDRTLIWNQRHLLRAPHEYQRQNNAHRPHRGISNTRPLHPLPEPITIQPRSHGSTPVDVIVLAASSTSTNRPRDLHGQDFRHSQGPEDPAQPTGPRAPRVAHRR